MSQNRKTKIGIGIDVGAYACKAALLRSNNLDAENLLYDGGNSYYSVVYVDENDNVVPFQKKRLSKKGFLCSDIKSKLLSGANKISEGSKLTYADLYVSLFKATLERCKREMDKRNEAIEFVVLTIPAMLEKKNDIVSTIKNAVSDIEIEPGRKVRVELLMEPAAAGIHNLNALKGKVNNIGKNNHTQIVYDIGHSTLDVALITLDSDGNFQQHFYETDNKICGEVFNNRIIGDIKKQISEAGYSVDEIKANGEAEISKAASKIKHYLSEHDQAVEDIELFDNEIMATLTRSRFNELIYNLVDDSTNYIEDAMEFAEENGIAVDEIILAGGGAMIPFIQEYIQNKWENVPVRRSLSPVEAVSYGAARYCLLKNLKQYAKLSYGICIPAQMGVLESKVQILSDAKTDLPLKTNPFSEGLRSDDDGIFRTTLYSLNGKGYMKAVDESKCTQIRHMNFAIGQNVPVSVHLEIDEEHCVKVVCTTNSGEKYYMTSYDSAKQQARKED